MTVQEILLLDSSADIRVGVAKLQQILNTMRMFRDERDELKSDYEVLGGEYDALARLLRAKIDEVDSLEVKVKVLELREDSLAAACAKKDAKIAELEAKLSDLANTKLRVGAIDITLDDL